MVVYFYSYTKQLNDHSKLTENVMNTRTIAAAALTLFLLGTANGQPYFANYESHQKADLARAEKNYIVCLKSGNDGIVESGLALIGRMKLYFPEREFNSLEKEISRLATEGKTERIRYKAYLINEVFANPTMFAAEGSRDYNNPDDLFTALANRLQANYLTASTSR